MRPILFVIGLLIAGSAFAQPDTDTDTEINADADVAGTMTTTTTTTTGTTTPVAMAPASGPVVAPDNGDPERDARGIPVLSDPAMIPVGFNGISGTTVGGPLVDPSTGYGVLGADDNYPRCSRNVTDNCVQTYERRGDPPFCPQAGSPPCP